MLPYRTADYDDLKVGIDAVMKDAASNFLGIAFDFTISSQEHVIEEKLAKHWENTIKKGIVPVIKYFKDSETQEKKRLFVPKFIIGGTLSDIDSLADAFLKKDAAALQDHPFKFGMLLQIEAQLDQTLAFYEQQEDQQRYAFAKRYYEKAKKIIGTIRAESGIAEKMNENVSLYEHASTSTAYKTITRFGNKMNETFT